MGAGGGLHGPGTLGALLPPCSMPVCGPQHQAPPAPCAGGKEGEKKEEIGKGKQQLVESRRRLYRVKHNTDQDVTSVRVGGDDRENLHRTAEEVARQVG